MEQEVEKPNTDEEKAGEAEQREQIHDELQPQDEEQPQQEIKADEQHGQHIPEAPAAEDQGQDHKVTVHLGQPEI